MFFLHQKLTFQKGNKENNTICIASKGVKYIEINVTKIIKKSTQKTAKTLMKEI